MNYEFILSKETNFFYWIQAICEWSIYGPEMNSYRHYRQSAGELSEIQTASLKKIASILLSSDKPRLILAELYKGMLESKDAKQISDNAASLRDIFENLWQNIAPDLLYIKNKLEEVDFRQYTNRLTQIATFLDVERDEGNNIPVYILQNTLESPSVGHQIENTDFILLHPEMRANVKDLNTTIGTLLHETIHIMEFKSDLAHKLSKDSYNEVIKKIHKPAPDGMTWKMVYSEVITYCFINNVTGGYLRPEVFSKPRFKLENMVDSFNRLEIKKPSDIIAWIALNIQDEVGALLEEGGMFNISIANEISHLILRYF